jgi:hypothetical protein
MRWSFWQTAKIVGSSGSKHSGRDKEYAPDLNISHPFKLPVNASPDLAGVPIFCACRLKHFSQRQCNVSKFVSKSVVGGRSYTSPEAILGQMRAFSSGEYS